MAVSAARVAYVLVGKKMFVFEHSTNPSILARRGVGRYYRPCLVFVAQRIPSLSRTHSAFFTSFRGNAAFAFVGKKGKKSSCRRETRCRVSLRNAFQRPARARVQRLPNKPRRHKGLEPDGDERSGARGCLTPPSGASNITPA